MHRTHNTHTVSHTLIPSRCCPYLTAGRRFMRGGLHTIPLPLNLTWIWAGPGALKFSPRFESRPVFIATDLKSLNMKCVFIDWQDSRTHGVALIMRVEGMQYKCWGIGSLSQWGDFKKKKGGVLRTSSPLLHSSKVVLNSFSLNSSLNLSTQGPSDSQYEKRMLQLLWQRENRAPVVQCLSRHNHRGFVPESRIYHHSIIRHWLRHTHTTYPCKKKKNEKSKNIINNTTCSPIRHSAFQYIVWITTVWERELEHSLLLSNPPVQTGSSPLHCWSPWQRRMVASKPLGNVKPGSQRTSSRAEKEWVGERRWATELALRGRGQGQVRPEEKWKGVEQWCSVQIKGG